MVKTQPNHRAIELAELVCQQDQRTY